MNLVSVKIDSTTDPVLMQKLRRHMFQDQSMMDDTLTELWQERHRMWPYAATKGTAILLYDDADKFVSWALVFRMNQVWNYFCWTLKSERRKGYASQIMKHAKGVYRVKKFKIHEHDKVSTEFFKACSST